MRTMLTVRMSVQAANKAVRDGKMGQVIGGFIEKYKPESAYFTTSNGLRTGFFVFDLSDPSQMPVIAEPFFMEVDAALDFAPVMNFQDLKKGLQI